jgi:hypothetical protein
MPNFSSFKVHKAAAKSVIEALHGEEIVARVREYCNRSVKVRFCPTRKECVKKALKESGYGDVTFCD